MDNLSKVLVQAHFYLGVGYSVPSYYGYFNWSFDTSPFYINALDKSRIRVLNERLNCAGLINLLTSRVLPNVPFVGGTYYWYNNCILENLTESTFLKAGSLLLRPYTSAFDPGHLALVVTSGLLRQVQIIHCVVSPDCSKSGVIREFYVDSECYRYYPFDTFCTFKNWYLN